ncbi:hypothetical protein BH11BAC4_BH11BAC4_14890 [soil metagenome]
MPKLLFLTLALSGISFILYQMHKTEKIKKSNSSYSG